MSTERARALRSNPTKPERRMWAILYVLRRQGYHFRRQVEIGPYYAGFACHHAALVVEIDGDTHGSDQDAIRDRRRDAVIRGRGYTVLRFWNDDVMHNPEGAFNIIVDTLTALGAAPLAPTPVPSPQGGGRRRTRKLRVPAGSA